jgi:hypothetical protein
MVEIFTVNFTVTFTVHPIGCVKGGQCAVTLSIPLGGHDYVTLSTLLVGRESTCYGTCPR